MKVATLKLMINHTNMQIGYLNIYKEYFYLSSACSINPVRLGNVCVFISNIIA